LSLNPNTQQAINLLFQLKKDAFRGFQEVIQVHSRTSFLFQSFNNCKSPGVVRTCENSADNGTINDNDAK